MYSNLNHVLEQVEKEKGIDKQVLIEAIESAMLTAANKKFGNQREIEASFNEELGEVELFRVQGSGRRSNRSDDRDLLRGCG